MIIIEVIFIKSAGDRANERPNGDGEWKKICMRTRNGKLPQINNPNEKQKNNEFTDNYVMNLHEFVHCKTTIWSRSI